MYPHSLNIMSNLAITTKGVNCKDNPRACNNSYEQQNYCKDNPRACNNSYEQQNYTDEDLWRENNNFAKTVIPAMVFVGVLMVIGCIGNSLVVYVYGFRFKSTTQNSLIVCLACFDLLMCSIAMPSEIADMRFHHVFTSVFACKLLRFITMFSSISSSFVLVVISVDRYIRITKPLTRQMSVKWARILEFISVIGSLLLSWPSLVMTGLRSSETEIPGLFGQDCSFSNEFANTKLQFAHNAVLGAGFIVVFTVLFLLYLRIWKTAKRRLSKVKKISKVTLSSGPESEAKNKAETPKENCPNSFYYTEDDSSENQRGNFENSNLKISKKQSASDTVPTNKREIREMTNEIIKGKHTKNLHTTETSQLDLEIKAHQEFNQRQRLKEIASQSWTPLYSTTEIHEPTLHIRQRAKSLDLTQDDQSLLQIANRKLLRPAFSNPEITPKTSPNCKFSEVTVSKILLSWQPLFPIRDSSMCSACLSLIDKDVVGVPEHLLLCGNSRTGNVLCSCLRDTQYHDIKDLDNSISKECKFCMKNKIDLVDNFEDQNIRFKSDLGLKTAPSNRNSLTKCELCCHRFKTALLNDQERLSSTADVTHKNKDAVRPCVSSICSCERDTYFASTNVTVAEDVDTNPAFTIAKTNKCDKGDKSTGDNHKKAKLHKSIKNYSPCDNYQKNHNYNCIKDCQEDSNLRSSNNEYCLNPTDELSYLDMANTSNFSHVIDESKQGMSPTTYVTEISVPAKTPIKNKSTDSNEIQKTCLTKNNKNNNNLNTDRFESVKSNIPAGKEVYVTSSIRRRRDFPISKSSSVYSITSHYPSIGSQSDNRARQRNMSVVTSSSSFKCLGKRISRNIDKMTMVAFSISFVFIVSFLPYLALMFVRAFVKDFDYHLHGASLCVYNMFLRFYLLNSAVNPLLYGWLNVKFRRECTKILQSKK